MPSYFLPDTTDLIYEMAVIINNKHKAGNRMKSRYGTIMLKPTDPDITTKRGVKQQTAIKIVPVREALNLFLYIFIQLYIIFY